MMKRAFEGSQAEPICLRRCTGPIRSRRR
ncbi:hypothetical protein Pint_28446 [Pistacia integerrima]|uniref:Uncharacterized protein n=1 Tax=Pistacia integerrima TaxID=434235 RepID=A0ACC0YNQ6_9ROSI|nr:hypothetical protein Pint_28446 [Pistacia integerrima]